MSYFTEVDDYKTYAGKEDDFHFIYNANTGGGQSFLGGKYRDQNGSLVSPTSLNGRTGVFRFIVRDRTNQCDVLLDNESVSYEIKPRAEGDSNMKLGVGGKPTPSEAIAAFLMLPKPCGVKKANDVNTSVLNGNNYWLQSMWLGVDTSTEGKAIFTPKDCIICGGVDKQGQGVARYFSVDFAKRFADIISAANNNELDGEVLSCVKLFADIYKGEKPFVYDESAEAIKAVMKYLSSKYPEEYSGTLDPLIMIRKLAHIKEIVPLQVQVDVRSDILAAIRTKPFILLAGISGTGKSRMVRQLAQGCCPSGHELGKDKAGNADKAKMPGNFEMIPVRPNWHDSTELMGYVTRLTDGNKPKYVIKPFVKFLVKAAIYKDVPFFLCLDEMNLAPVEQYFAEYLSIVETRKKENGAIISDVLVNFDLPEIDVVETVKELMKDWWSLDADNNLQWATADAKAVYDKIVADKGIRIPENFIVMGTVNMDETTCSFSRKVLDRAMTFELNEVDMDEGLAEDNSIRYGLIPASSAFATDVEGCDFYAANKDTCEKIKTYLIAVNKVLDGTPFKFAYRSRNEIMLYCIERTKGGIVELPQALDEATSMKILSRIEGDEQKLQVPKRDNNGNIVKSADGRAEMVCLLDKGVLPKVIADALKNANGDTDPIPPCTVCSEKLAFMAGRLESGFTNFFI